MGDVDDLFAVYGDPEVMRHWSTPPHADRRETEAMVKRHISASQSVLTYFVLERDGHAIGCGGVHEGDEIGFILGAAHWRQGIMTEALGAMIPYFFDDLHYPQLTADADPRNAASVATLRKAGFVQTGEAKNTYFVNGEWSDSVYFKLTAPKAP
ncbi:GNAT family N-acetyltransferase [Marivita sp. S6314]|nr:GNAT family N-acetyltransferase [Marivita sp. S6314]